MYYDFLSGGNQGGFTYSLNNNRRFYHLTGTYRHVKGSKNKSFAVTGGRSVRESDLEIFPAGFQSSVLRFFVVGLAGLMWIFNSWQSLFSELYLWPISWTAATLIDLAGVSVVLRQPLGQTDSCIIEIGRIIFHVEHQCSGISAFFIFLAALGAYPASLGYKVYGAHAQDARILRLWRAPPGDPRRNCQLHSRLAALFPPLFYGCPQSRFRHDALDHLDTEG